LKLLVANPDTHIILACRNVDKGKQARDFILKQYLLERKFDIEPQIVVEECNLSEIKSVLQFCRNIKAKYTRLDYLYLNAGIMPSKGIDLVTGLRNLITRPSYVARTGGDIIKQEIGQVNSDGLGFVFASNCFGHFVMVRELTELMEKTGQAVISWCSSTTAAREFLDIDDFQCLAG
jgi:17beta-estradiol 17-dehydrogenase/3beta-hydroxysteroid 3-dehydrogenase